MKDLVGDPGPANALLRKSMNSGSSFQIGCIKRKEEKKNKTGLSSLSWEWGSSIFYRMLWTVVVFQWENATAAEQRSLPRSGRGFCLTVTQDGPQFRTQSLGQNSRRCSLSLRAFLFFSSSVCPRSFIFSLCVSLICVTLPSLSCFPPIRPPSLSFLSSSSVSIMISLWYSLPLMFSSWLMCSFTIINILRMQMCASPHFWRREFKTDKSRKGVCAVLPLHFAHADTLWWKLNDLSSALLINLFQLIRWCEEPLVRGADELLLHSSAIWGKGPSGTCLLSRLTFHRRTERPSNHFYFELLWSKSQTCHGPILWDYTQP